MSTNYILTCIDCKSGIDLSTVVGVHYKNETVRSYGFAATGNINKRIQNNESIDVLIESIEELDLFLMLHRTHELRVLPESVQVFASNIGFPNDLLSSEERSSFLNTDVGVVDHKEDLKNLPPSLIEKLKEF